MFNSGSKSRFHYRWEDLGSVWEMRLLPESCLLHSKICKPEFGVEALVPIFMLLFIHFHVMFFPEMSIPRNFLQIMYVTVFHMNWHRLESNFSPLLEYFSSKFQEFPIKKKKKFFFFFFCLIAAWDLSSTPGIESMPPAVKAQTLNDWTSREVPDFPKM